MMLIYKDKIRAYYLEDNKLYRKNFNSPLKEVTNRSDLIGALNFLEKNNVKINFVRRK